MIIYPQHIDTQNAIYETINTIDEYFQKQQVVSVLFHEEVRFVDPLFFILLINLNDKYKIDSKILVIDIIDLDYSKEIVEQVKKTGIPPLKKDVRQHYIHRLLLQFLDMPYFSRQYQGEYNKIMKDYIYPFDNSIEVREKSYEETALIIDNAKRSVLQNSETGEIEFKSVFFYYTKKHEDSLFQKDEEFRHLLPIFKLTNFPTHLLDSSSYNDQNDLFLKRKQIYMDLLLDKESQTNYRPSFEKAFDKIFNAVKPNQNSESLESVIPPLKNLIFESIDNIKRHTEQGVNSYFCFYHDPISKQFKLIISDDSCTGFLNTYQKTLQDECDLINEELGNDKFDIEIEKNYIEEIYLLENANVYSDIKVLQHLFDQKSTFKTHQIPRIVMHFGIPTLIKIISEVKGTFDIRVHRKTNNQRNYYQIKHPSTENLVQVIDKSFDGTHIYITIPDDASYIAKKPQPLHLEPQYTSQVRDEYEQIKREVDQFVSIQKDGSNPSRIFDYNNYFQADRKKNTISDFLRELYFIAYQKKVADALVINFPIKKYELYLQNLVHILYSKPYDTVHNIPLNVIFFDKSSLDIVFIGGKNFSEFYKSNQLIAHHYGHYNHQITDIFNSQNIPQDSQPVVSKFFYKTKKDDFIVLPFELIDDSELSIQRLLIEKLRETQLAIHVDAGKGYHISNFYRFDIIFQDSRNIERMSYKFVDYLKKRKLHKNVKFIGIGKYSNLLLATLHRELDKEISDDYFIVSDIKDPHEHSQLKLFFEKYNSSHSFVIYTPVTFDGEFVKSEIIQRYSSEIVWINTIQLILEGAYSSEVTTNCYSLIKFPIHKEHYFNLNDHDGCKLCNGDEELPLYKIDNKNYFAIEDCYISPYKNKLLTTSQKTNAVKWAKSIHFGHVKRGENHYLYYPKPLQFYSANNSEISLFLTEAKNSLKAKLIDASLLQNKQIIMITPMHRTHNKFVTLVNSILFSNRATIYQIDQTRGDSNFYNTVNEIYDEDALIFYIDDEISSSQMIEYFHSLVKEKNPFFGFDGIVAMIDRMSERDEKNIAHFIDQKNFKKEQINKLDQIYVYAKLEIRPIKTTALEDCFLCKRRNQYIDLLNSTVLDINRFQIINRIVKLNIEDHNLIDFPNQATNQNCKDKDSFTNQIKKYFKMSAVDYIYEKFSLFDIKHEDRKFNDDFKLYEKLESDFTDYMLNIIRPLFKDQDKYGKILLEICHYEASISLIKALSFPKLVYFETIRYIATVALIHKIKHSISINEPLALYFNKEKLEQFIQAQSNQNNASFLSSYEDKKNMDYSNFLYITASYLNINYVLHIDSLNYYSNAAMAIKHKGDKEVRLLQPFQFATKLVAMYSKDKSDYLEKQLKLFFSDKHRSDDIIDQEYSLLDALMLENNLTISKRISKLYSFKEALEYIPKSNLPIQKKIEQCMACLYHVCENGENNENSLIESTIRDLVDKYNNKKPSHFRIEHFYINENIHIKYNDFESYLEGIKLCDVANNFQEVKANNLKHVMRLVKGALSSDKENSMRIERNEDQEIFDIDDTWANEYVENFATNDGNKPCLLVKLVDIDTQQLQERICAKTIHNVWYKPMGCIVLSFDGKRTTYLELVRTILSVQKNLVDFFKEEFSHETFREIITSTNYQQMYSSFLHNEADMVDLHNDIKKAWKECQEYIGNNQAKERLEKYFHMLEDYAYGVAKIGRIGQLKMEESNLDKCSTNIYKLINDEKERIDNFITMSVKKKYARVPINIQLHDSCKEFNINLNSSLLSTIFYELFYNAAKYADSEHNEVYIYVENLTLYIKNRRGDTQGIGFHIATGYIQNIFEKINYIFDDKKSNEKEYVITIKEN